LTDQSASEAKISRRYAIDADVVDLNNAVANLKFGVLTIKASKKPAQPFGSM
jgi:HSP20 family molecular chaperone IbpA